MANEDCGYPVYVNGPHMPSPTAAKDACMKVDDLILASIDDHHVEPPDMFL